ARTVGAGRGACAAVSLGREGTVAVAGVAGLRACGTTRPAIPACDAIGRAPKTDAPAVLADLELTETRRAELRDQRRQQLARQAIDRRMVGGMPTVSGIVDRQGLGHSLDLLVGGRLVARPHARRDRHGPPAGT